MKHALRRVAPAEAVSIRARTIAHSGEQKALGGPYALLGAQRAAGNRAVVSMLAGGKADAALQRMTFSRFSWGGPMTNWGWHNDDEKRLLALEKSADHPRRAR